MKKAMLVWFLCALAMMAGASVVEAVQPMVAAGRFYTIGLKSDSTAVATGIDWEGYRIDVGDWTNIIQVAAGFFHTVGLKNDGTVLAVGDNLERYQCEVDDWTNIAQIAAGGHHTVGLKDDGTVVVVGYNQHGQLDVGDWTNITQVAAGGFHTVGLKNDGTVVAVGYNEAGQLDVDGWTNITQVSAGWRFTVGLKSDGTVVAVGSNSYGQTDVSSWTDITQITAGDFHTVGLKSDGTVMTVGYNDFGQISLGDWTDITQVDGGDVHTVGLKSDGTVIAVGGGDDEMFFVEHNVSDWNLYVGAGQYGTIEGQVADASGSVAGAAVELFFIGKVASTVTDAEGYYQFENVAEGNYRVHVIPPEDSPNIFYVTDARLKQVSVQPETTRVADFVMTKMNSDIYGDGDIDQEDIQVINYLRGKDTTLCPDCDIDEDGAITGLDARKAIVQCTRPGCAVE